MIESCVCEIFFLSKNNEWIKWNKLLKYIGFPGDTSGKESTFQFRRCRIWGFNPWVGKIPWRRKWPPTSVRGFSESQTWFSDWTTASILAWRIPRTAEPGGLQSMWSQRVGNNWATEHTHCWNSKINQKS